MSHPWMSYGQTETRRSLRQKSILSLPSLAVSDNDTTDVIYVDLQDNQYGYFDKSLSISSKKSENNTLSFATHISNELYYGQERATFKRAIMFQ